MNETLACCNRTYIRTAEGWHYHWGAPVPGATDLTLADLMLVDEDIDCADTVGTFRTLTPAERRWLSGDHGAIEEVLLCQNRRGGPPHAGDLIIGLLAPELHVQLMLTVGEIAAAAEVSKATIDSYRYRGYLPEPQVTQGRTPLWARPVISRWLATRPGPGWRTDLYDTGDELTAAVDGELARAAATLGAAPATTAPAGARGVTARGAAAKPRHTTPRTRPGVGRTGPRRTVRSTAARPARPTPIA